MYYEKYMIASWTSGLVKNFLVINLFSRNNRVSLLRKKKVQYSNSLASITNRQWDERLGNLINEIKKKKGWVGPVNEKPRPNQSLSDAK